jgi:hypothetical protein
MDMGQKVLLFPVHDDQKNADLWEEGLGMQNVTKIQNDRNIFVTETG